jgi:hypothetical protein
MLPHQGSNPAVTPHSLKIGHDIETLKKEIKEWPAEDNPFDFSIRKKG